MKTTKTEDTNVENLNSEVQSSECEEGRGLAEYKTMSTKRRGDEVEQNVHSTISERPTFFKGEPVVVADKPKARPVCCAIM